MSRVCVFLDRDGTINEEIQFLRTPDDLVLIPGAADAIRKLNDRGIATCVISNQSGVARGFLTEEDLGPIHRELQRKLHEAAGARIDRIYYCPHHPTEGIAPYNIVCDCRKPATGMLQRARSELHVDLDQSFVVGDRGVDVQVGKAVGATTILVLTGYGRTALEEFGREKLTPDHVAPSLSGAVEHILMNLSNRKLQTNARTR